MATGLNHPNDSIERSRALVIGASAGGLEALRLLVPTLALDEGLYAVVAVHLSPNHRSMLSELLGRDTTAQVEDLQDGLVPQPGHLYVVPSGCQPRLEDGKFRLEPSSLPGVPKPSIDALMQSMAEALGESLIAVVLSGTGSDGSRGVRAVRAHGGLVLVQEPADARYDSMPLHAIETRAVHHIAPAAALGQVIRQALHSDAGDASLGESDQAADLELLVQSVRTAIGFDLGAYKPATLLRRLGRRMRVRACASLREYRLLLAGDEDEAHALVQELLISVTGFFRDPSEFEALVSPLHACMLAAAAEGRDVRIWVAGCATGEEAYSLALMTQALGREMEQPPKVRIFATDIDTEALELARRGVYPAEALHEVPAEWRSQELEVGGDLMRISPALREVVIFSPHNLLRDPPFLRLDLLACRNVLIYLQADWQRWLLRNFQASLGDHGVLMLGRAETPASAEQFEHVRLVPDAALFRLRSGEVPSALRMPAVAGMGRANAPRRPVGLRPADLGQLLLVAHSAGALAPGWVMTDQGQLQHTFGDVSGLLQLHGGGPATLEVPRLCDQRLWLELRALVFQGRQQPGKPVFGWHRRIRDGVVRLSVLALAQHPLCVVMVAEPAKLGVHPEPVPEIEVSETGDGSVHPQELAHLREHANATQQHLQTLVSELDAANEELQLLNEELQSSNEELQSTNEELATSNEELQSTNEELITVNEELQMRTTELALRNADLDNVRNSLRDPLVVVDEHGRVILRNGAAEALWDFGSVGTRGPDRPLLAALPCSFAMPEFLEGMRGVLERGDLVDLELAGPDERMFAARIQPYIGRLGERCGAVAVLRDITQAARLQRELTVTNTQLARSEALRRATVDALPDLVAVLDDAGVITGVNASWITQASRWNGARREDQLGVGADYGLVCERSAAAGDALASEFLRGLKAVQGREQEMFEFTYPCHGVDEKAWYRVSVTALQGTGRSVVVRHQNITAMHELLARLQLLARALDAGPNGIVICDALQPGRPVIYVNEAFQSLTGYGPTEVVGRSCSLLQGSDRQQAGLQTLRQALAAMQPVRVLLRNYRKSGEMFWNELTLSMVRDPGGRVTHMVGVQRDMTSLLESEEALRASLRREARAMSFAGIGSIDWRLRDGLMLLSSQQARLFDLDSHVTELRWSALRERVHPDDLPVLEDAVKVCVAGHASLDIEFRLRSAQGVPRWLHLQGDAERNDTGTATHLIAICQDITARRAAEEHATHLSQHDGLTGLPNRSLLRDRLQLAVLQAVRDRSRLALLFIDLDRFKEVNDSLGHSAGDELLCQVATRLRQAVRDSDTVSRIGGDEFVVLLTHLHSADEASRVADKLVQSLREPLVLREHSINITASIGVSLYPDDGRDGEELLRHADSAMYRAKGSGREAVCFFSRDADSAVHENLTLRAGMRQAAARDQLVLHFQPQLDLQSRSLVGMEALLRWQHPERGLLHPAAFLPALDDPALATEVGEWVFEACCRQIDAWRDTPLAQVPVAVNVSPLQLRGSGLVRLLSSLLGRTRIRPEQLEIEITEHALVDHHLGAGDTLRDCRKLGIGIALDDFGTGFSSLSLLHQHPISRIKIDQSFCRRLPEDPKSAGIVRAMIDMARNLSVGVVAEGIETEAQADFLRDAGCRQVQGYLYAKPASAEAIEAWCHAR